MPKVTFDEGFSTEDLEGEAENIAKLIKTGLREFYQQADEDSHLESGGCKFFHQGNGPGWGSRRGVLLTLVCEGTDVDHFFSMDRCYDSKIGYSTYEYMQGYLLKAGYHVEQYNSCVVKIYNA